MARLKASNRGSGFLETARNDISQALLNTGTIGSMGISTESIDVMTSGKTSQVSFEAFSDTYEHLKDLFGSAAKEAEQNRKVSTEGLSAKGAFAPTDAQLEAATIMAMASASPENAAAYARAAFNPAVSVESGVQIINPSDDPARGFSTETYTPSLEAFDARALENNRMFNVLYAFSAARQDEFGEAFFKTLTLSPDNAGFEVSQRRTMIMKEVKHDQNGTPLNLDRRNLLDAFNDPTILTNETTKIVPRYDATSTENLKHFVDAKLVAPWKTIANGTTPITTSALSIGVTHGLIGLGINAGTKGTPDQTDPLDHAVKIVKVYVQVTTASGSSVIAFNARSLAQNTFLKSQQGLDRRITLDFPATFTVDASTTDVTGSAAAALAAFKTAPFATTQVSLTTDITGSGNYQLGSIAVNATPVQVASARDVQGPNNYSNITDKDTLSTLAGLFTSINVIGYEVEANAANLNRREIGLLIDSVEERVRYVIPLSSPISVQTPITATTTATDMAGPMNAQRITNSINAVTKILEIRDTLRDVAPLINYRSPTDPAPAIEGFGRLMVRPYLVDEKLNVADVISSPATANRLQDVQAALINKLRYSVVSAYTESRYQPVLDAYNGTVGERPHVVIGTDPTTASYLMINGDPRILGLGFETKVVVSYDIRVRNKIFASFVRPNVTDVDVMSLGVFAYIPELATKANIPYNGAFTDVTQVQNRNLHVCLLPVLVYIEVEGLDTAAADRVALPVAVW